MPVWRPKTGWLEQAVGSVLEQPGCEVELIVVDDGNTPPVVDVLAVEDVRLRVLRVDHGGVSRARNAGIAVARGRYLRFVDADDAVEPGSTARLLTAADGAAGVISYGATCFCDERLRGEWVLRSDVQGDAELSCLLGRFTVRLPSLLFPRAVAEAAGPWDPALEVSEDWDWILRTLGRAEVSGDRSVATRYRRAGGGATSDVQAGMTGARLVVQRWLDRHPEHRGTRVERRAEAMLSALSARVHLSRGEVRQGLRATGRALVLDPAAVAAEVRGAVPALRGRLAARAHEAVRAATTRRAS